MKGRSGKSRDSSPQTMSYGYTSRGLMTKNEREVRSPYWAIILNKIETL